MYKPLVIFFLLVCNMVHHPADAAQLQSKAPVMAKHDTSKLTIRNFDQKRIAEYRKQREFIYDNIEPADFSFWDRFWRWLGRYTAPTFENKSTGNTFKYVSIAILAALFVFLITKITKLDLWIIFGKSKSVDVPYHESLENIHEINFDEDITRAVSLKNYRLAVRLLYLSTLKRMSDKNLIDWQPEKTNQAYVEEIADPSKKQLFKSLTIQFEYIWYGEFFIDKDNFNTIKALFDNFNPGKS